MKNQSRCFLVMLCLCLVCASLVSGITTWENPLDSTNLFNIEEDSINLFNPKETVMSEAKKALHEALQLILQGRYDLAIEKTRQVLATEPRLAMAHEILGIALTKKGLIDDGLKEFGLAVEIEPERNTALTKMGDVFLAKNDLQKGKSFFLRAIAANPTDRLAHQRLGIVFESEGDFAKATEHYEKGLLGAPPDYIGIKVNLGRLYNLAKNYEKTIQLLTPLVNDQTSNPMAHYVLGAAYLGLKKNAEALKYFDWAKRLDSDPARSHLAMGLAYRESGELEKSLQEFNQVVQVKPDWVEGHLQKAETLTTMGKIDLASQSFALAAECSTNAVNIRNRLAEIRASQGQFKEAIALYEKLRSEGLANIRTLDGLATAYQLAGDLPKGSQVLKEACRQYKDSPYPLYRLGLFQGYSQDYTAAVKTLSHALEMSPADPLILKALSLAESRRGQVKSAIGHARKLAQLVPQNVEERFYLAALLQDDKQDKEAVAAYRDVLKSEPRHLGALNNLATLLAVSGHLDEALLLAKQAVALAPQNGSILDTYGWILCQKEDFQSAQQSLEKAISVNPRNPTYRYHLGIVYYQTKQMDKAAIQFNEAIGLSSKYPERGLTEEMIKKLDTQK
jgi:tetratricopeptide (TPR) repeat protein